ncbi:unnamed protein product [Albugo candida]|uniref:3-deoxy-7-phosphoheptulonate synthase n=1 Tax=Albugo candida TaxID=65357 RepID=A0A024GBB6_9STRA|nr:unnamed protein product [Albugo candida]|eukprot:CCI43934.1 unnamed protein product [Albugo candida]
MKDSARKRATLALGQPSNLQSTELLHERAVTRLRIDIDTVRGTLLSRFMKNFLYFWIVLLVILGLLVLSSGLYLLHYQESSRILPSFTYKAASYAGAILVVLSVFGLYGLHKQRMCVTLGKRNYALASFVILSIGGAIVVALAGCIAILLCNIAREATSSAFETRKVRSFEVAVVRMLLIFASKHPSCWQNVQESMDCCGYSSLHPYIKSGLLPQLEFDSESLTRYAFLNGSEYQSPFLQSVMIINNITGKGCATQSAFCEPKVTFDDIPCPKKESCWCRTTVLHGAKSNYHYIGFIAVILGCAQILACVSGLYVWLCDIRMLPQQSEVIEITPVPLAPHRLMTENANVSKRAKLEDLHVTMIRPLIPPACVREELPVSCSVHKTITAAREQVCDILHGGDDRLVVVVGPCSIHDVDAAMEYAKLLRPLQEELSGELLILMRTYFEKPRTTIGWKGLINDPDLDSSFNINKGIRVARKLLLDINALGVPVALEFLDTISPQFICDLVSWGAIGARTTESQLHRELTSGLSMPVGFKNGTGGDIKIAVDATLAASSQHNFLGLNEHGLASIVMTKGNKNCHVILRGGKDGPNYEEEHLTEAVHMLNRAKLPAKVMIDCSHGNSQKIHSNQIKVAEYIAQLIEAGNVNLLGVMLESNLVEGNQSLTQDKSKLVYGKSITDACINWNDTEIVLRRLARAVATKRSQNQEPN